MDTINWLKQANKALFPEIDWDKPERRDQAGKLLIVGGNIHALNAPLKAYDSTKRVGIGHVVVALPDKTKFLLPKPALETLLLPSTASGEFAKEGIAELTAAAQAVDTILLPGDSGRNSQTTFVFEELLRTLTGRMVLTRDAVDSLSHHPASLFERSETTLVLSFSQLQRLLRNYSYPRAVSFSMDLVTLVQLLAHISTQVRADFLVLHHNQLIVAVNGKVSTTKLPDHEHGAWRLKAASYASCYLTWSPAKAFEALSETAYQLR